MCLLFSFVFTSQGRESGLKQTHLKQDDNQCPSSGKGDRGGEGEETTGQKAKCVGVFGSGIFFVLFFPLNQGQSLKTLIGFTFLPGVVFRHQRGRERYRASPPSRILRDMKTFFRVLFFSLFSLTRGPDSHRQKTCVAFSCVLLTRRPHSPLASPPPFRRTFQCLRCGADKPQ